MFSVLCGYQLVFYSDKALDRSWMSEGKDLFRVTVPQDSVMMVEQVGHVCRSMRFLAQ